MAKEFLSKKEIIETITPVIENTAMRNGLIPVEIALDKENGHHFLRIYIYSQDHSISHFDCEKMSRALGDMLDELIPFKYYLEISSLGLDRKFKSKKEFIIFTGHDVIIKLKNQIDNINTKTLNAVLMEYSENYGIKVEYEGKILNIGFDNIQSVKLNDKIEINKNKGDNND